MKSITTSIRLSNETRQRLELASQLLKHGKNWIINQALQAYLNRLDKKQLAQEARRQSLLASQASQTDDAIWEQNHDSTHWTT